MKQTFFRRSPSRILLTVNLIFIIIVFILSALGAFRKHIGPGNLAIYNGRKMTLVGRICEEADVDYKSRRLTLCLGNRDAATGLSIKGRALITANLYPEYDYGDFLKVSGELRTPPLIDGFDYESYLARYDIYSVMY